MVPNEVREFLKRKRIVGDWETQADALGDMLAYADDAQQAPPQGEEDVQVVAPESALRRKPTVTGAVAGAAVPPPAPETDPVREYVRKRLSAETIAPATVDPTLENRARMSGKLANVVNTLMAGAGLQPTFKAFDYATPDLERRREIQEWVAKQQAAKDVFGLRALGADGEAAQNRYNMGELERRKKADDVKESLERERLGLAGKQLNARVAAEARHAKAKEEEAVKKLDGARISYFSDIYRPISGSAPDPTMQNKARDFFSKSANAMTAISEFRNKLNAAISAPIGGGFRQQALAELGTAATSLNAFLGQGAMAEGEFARVKQSLGQVGGLDYLMDVARRWRNGDDSELSAALSRTDATLDLVRKITDNSIRPLGYEKEASTAPASAWKAGEVRADKTGRKLKKLENGKYEVVP